MSILDDQDVQLGMGLTAAVIATGVAMAMLGLWAIPAGMVISLFWIVPAICSQLEKQARQREAQATHQEELDRMRRHSELQLALEQEKTRRELAVLDEKRKDAERKELAQQQEASRKANDARKSVQEKKHARLKALKRLKRDYLRTKAMIDGSDLAKEDRAAALNVAYQEYMEAKSRLSEGLYE